MLSLGSILCILPFFLLRRLVFLFILLFPLSSDTRKLRRRSFSSVPLLKFPYPPFHIFFLPTLEAYHLICFSPVIIPPCRSSCSFLSFLLTSRGKRMVLFASHRRALRLRFFSHLVSSDVQPAGPPSAQTRGWSAPRFLVFRFSALGWPDPCFPPKVHLPLSDGTLGLTPALQFLLFLCFPSAVS